MTAVLKNRTNVPPILIDHLGIGIYGDAFVYFKDGSKVKIKEVVGKKLEGEILTLNEKKRIFEYKKIINWHKLGTVKSNADLIHVQTEGLGKNNDDKNGIISVILAPTHKILTKRGWIEANKLILDDLLVTSYISILHGEMEKFLYALTVGDSHFHANSDNSKNTASLILNDSNNPGYVKWKINKLSNGIAFHKNSLGWISEWTHDLKLLKDRISKFSVSSLRSPLPFLGEHFSLLGLAIYIMDDGHFDKRGKNYSLSIGRLRKHKGVLGITSHWFNKLGYKNNIMKQGGLRFDRKVSYKIATEICSFVPECMQYKLPEDLKNKYKEFYLEPNFKLVPEYIKFKSERSASDRQMNKMKGKYELGVESNNNYMAGNHANGVIVKDSTNSYPKIHC